MPATPIRILHVVAPASFGGLESVVRMLASGHTSRGHHVHVLSIIARGWASRREPHPFTAALEQAGVAVMPLPIGDRDYLGERAAVAAIIGQLNVSVVHSHGFRSDVVDASVARRLGVRTVSTVHGFVGGSRRSRVYEWLQRRALRRFDAVACVSRAIAERVAVAGVPTGRVHVVPNAFAADPAMPDRITARRELGIPEATHVIGWVGRLSREKGPDVALHALAQLARPDAFLVVIGDGSAAAALRGLADRLGISERVRWMGAIAGAGRFFPAFDTFLLSSRTEGTPVVLLEAMAAGVPIVASAVGGVPDLLSEEQAWLVPSEDVARMARALSLRLEEPDRARAKAEAARARLANDYGMEPWLDRYESLYRISP